MTEAARTCAVCGAPAGLAGRRLGAYRRDREFLYFTCDRCRFTFVGNPWTDYTEIYSEAYYDGRGADPSVDYHFELQHPQSCIRSYEWRGLARIVPALSAGDPGNLRWLDYGCGNGGLVRFVRSRLGLECLGYEEGAIAERARACGIPILSADELQEHAGTFDVVTAIEVIEHVVQPVDFLRRMRALLRPGGTLFLTTGNARPWRGRILQWSYASVPEVHVGFFEPETLALSLSRAGFRPEFRGYLPGFTDVIRFKVLKSLGARRRSAWIDVLPWHLIARIVDWRYGVTHHPVGIAA